MRTKSINPQFLTDSSGKKAFVVLTVKEYEEFLEDLHDLAVIGERRNEPRIGLEEFEEGLRTAGRL